MMLKRSIFKISILMLASAVYAEESPSEGEVALLDEPYLVPAKNYQDEIFLPQTEIKKRKSANLAAILSIPVPGLGYTYLGEYRDAWGFMGSSVVLAGLSKANKLGKDFQGANSIALQNLGFYSVYACYRDARAYNQYEGYSFQMPKETLLDLTLAPFQWSVIKKPEVWGGLLGALTLAAGLGYVVYGDKTELRLSAKDEDSIFPLLAFPIGIGEEAFFRGYLQSTFSEVLSPWGGIALSSLCFGAVHIANAQRLEKEDRPKYYAFSLPLITTFGAYFGWLTYKNHSLKESVAIHAWYDFTLFLAAYSAASTAAIGKPTFAFSFSF